MTTLQTRTQVQAAPPADLAPERPAGHTTGWWGMVLFVVSEATTFAAFLASYFYLRFAHSAPWPPVSDRVPDLFWPSIGTGAMIVSSLPLFLAIRAVARDRRAVGAVTVLAAWCLGVLFVVCQLLDWSSEFPSSTLQKDAYGSLFYTIAGLHLAHVVAGLLMLLVLVVRALPRTAGWPKPGPVGVVAIYWYLMVAVAVAIYVVVYLSPYS